MALTLKGEIRDLLGLEGNLVSGETEQPSSKFPGVFNHPDFEIDNSRHGHDRGIVQLNLGRDGTPEHIGRATRSTQGPVAFHSWYHNDPKFNRFHRHDIPLQESGRPGVYVFEDEEFFPLDTVRNSFGKQRRGDAHNYHFTYAVKAHEFTYTGKEEFFFRGDDDLWLFLNGKLVVDLGGTHEALEGRVNLQIGDNEDTFDKPLMDATLLGPNHPLAKNAPNERLILKKGDKVRFDLFFAERHRTKSRFKIETSMVLAPPPVIVTIEATDPQAKEFPTDTGEFTVSLDRPADERLVVLYEVSGTAQQGPDYQRLQPIVFERGEQTTSIIVTPKVDDDATEGTETVIVTLKEPRNRGRDPKYQVGNPYQATVKIEDYVPPLPIATIVATMPMAEEPQPLLSKPGVNGEFQISIDKALNVPLVIHYTVSGDATPGVDYIALPPSVTIPAGETFAVLSVIPQRDDQLEQTESVIVTLTEDPQSQYDVGTMRSDVVKIQDCTIIRPVAGVRATKPEAFEQGEVPGEFEIFLDLPAFKDITVAYSLAGTATEGVDYRPLMTATILQGETSVRLPVSPIDDAEIEPDETVIINLLAGMDYDLDPDAVMATVTIISDDVPAAPPVVSIQATVPVAQEPNTQLGLPGVNGEFTITIDKRLNDPLEVNCVVNGTATPGPDYIPLTIPVTIPAGDTSMTLPVIPEADALQEADETVIVTLLDAPNNEYVVDDRTAQVIIQSPKLIIASVKATQPLAREEGPVPGQFTVFLNQLAPEEITVEYQLSGTATQGTDYKPLIRAVIPKGQTAVALPVIPIDDAIIENDETVIITLVDRPSYDPNPSAQTATVKIIDNDVPVASISASVPFAKEPQSQVGLPGQNGEFTISVEQPVQEPLTLYFNVGGNASPGADYAPLSSPVTIPAGQRMVKLPVVPVADRLAEGNEAVVVSLVDDPHGRYAVSAARTATVTIQDCPPIVARVRATQPTAREEGPVPGEFTISLNQPAPADLVVQYRLAGTAQANDYQPLPAAVFRRGMTSVILKVTPIADQETEGNETVVLVLQDDPKYDVDAAARRAVVTIIDNPPAPPVAKIKAKDPHAMEPESGRASRSQQGKFVITLNKPAPHNLTIQYGIKGDATPGHKKDYLLTRKNGKKIGTAARNNTIVIPKGKRRVEAFVVPLADLDFRRQDENEDVVMQLLPGTEYTLPNQRKHRIAKVNIKAPGPGGNPEGSDRLA